MSELDDCRQKKAKREFRWWRNSAYHTTFRHVRKLVLDYASYVILERAVPDINDGLKPVQRRIMHAMKNLDDGRYNKVANIIGHTMQYHPHGDASIGDALVQLGQKELLIDAQGTGEIPLQVTAQRLHVILKPVSQNLPAKWSLTLRPPTGSFLMTVEIRSRLICL